MKLLYHIFRNDSCDYLAMRRVIILNSFYIIGMIAFASFAFINLLLTQDYLVSLLDLALFIIFFLLYIDLNKNKNLLRSSVIGTCMIALFMFFFAYLNHNTGFGLIWTIFVPIFGVALFGSKQGIIISFIYYLLLFSLLFYGLHYWEDSSWNLLSFLRLVFASLVLLWVLYVTENSFEKVSLVLEKMTYTDTLTKLYNRRKIDEIMAEKCYDYERYGTSLSIAILDIDDFKEINDTYGHDVGDKVLSELSQILKENSRKSDIIARWGGEEFMFIMQNTEKNDALKTMEKLREVIAKHTFTIVGHITCSIGVCEINKDISNANKLFSCADKALYKSKHNGKNSVSDHT
jgi:diguanylate cyclase (GGDEF)-like protein